VVNEAVGVDDADGPFFDDFTPGETLPLAPAMTIGPKECDTYDLICGDPLAISRSRTLSAEVTGIDRSLVNPGLVLQMAIGQSTVATRRVIANLFYRGVRLRKHLRVGATISTSVQIHGLSEATRRSDRVARGKVLLGMIATDDHGDMVVEFERCALLPLRDPEAEDTGHHDDLGGPESVLDLSRWMEWVPRGWDLCPLGPPSDWQPDEARFDPAHHTVSRTLDLLDLTQNQALAHRDAAFGQDGRRLVYGGHTIALAQTSLARLLPSMATIVGWHSCDHAGPVFEEDSLECIATLTDLSTAPGGRLLAFDVEVLAHRTGSEPDVVLRWRPVVYAP